MRSGPFLALALALAAVLPSAAAARDAAACARLESQLAQIEATASQATSARAARFDRAIREQQAAIDINQRHRTRAGCGGSRALMFLQPAGDYCADIARHIGKMQANLADLRAQRAAMTPRHAGGDAQLRVQLLAALGQNGCGAQYARFSAPPRPHGTRLRGEAEAPDGMRRDEAHPHPPGNYRTLCVRNCDGFFWPISFTTGRGGFERDAQACRAACPGANVSLYVHRNPGQGIDEAVSLGGEPYAAHPNAFAHRTRLVRDCSCQPATERPQAEDTVAATPVPSAAPTPAPPATERAVRVVGPTFSYRREAAQ